MKQSGLFFKCTEKTVYVACAFDASCSPGAGGVSVLGGFASASPEKLHCHESNSSVRSSVFTGLVSRYFNHFKSGKEAMHPGIRTERIFPVEDMLQISGSVFPKLLRIEQTFNSMLHPWLRMSCPPQDISCRSWGNLFRCSNEELCVEGGGEMSASWCTAVGKEYARLLIQRTISCQWAYGTTGCVYALVNVCCRGSAWQFVQMQH